MTLPPGDRVKLVSILGMLGSDHAGERASAALLASRMLRDRGLQWNDVVAEAAEAPSASWRCDLEFCERHTSELSDWEANFVSNIRAKRPTERQQAVLRDIVAQMRRDGLA